MGLTRREILMAGGVGSAALAGVFSSSRSTRAQEDLAEFVKRRTGRMATVSDRLHLVMPAVFPTGYTVPMDSSRQSHDRERLREAHPRVRTGEPAHRRCQFRVCPAAQRPPRVDAHPSRQTAIRRGEYAEMGDGTLLMAKTYVDVATNGCI